MFELIGVIRLAHGEQMFNSGIQSLLGGSLSVNLTVSLHRIPDMRLVQVSGLSLNLVSLAGVHRS